MVFEGRYIGAATVLYHSSGSRKIAFKYIEGVIESYEQKQQAAKFQNYTRLLLILVSKTTKVSFKKSMDRR